MAETGAETAAKAADYREIRREGGEFPRLITVKVADNFAQKRRKRAIK
jgi:hypothetical protein